MKQVLLEAFTFLTGFAVPELYTTSSCFHSLTAQNAIQAVV